MLRSEQDAHKNVKGVAEGVGVKQGASIAAKMLGGRKQGWYARLQAMKGQH